MPTPSSNPFALWWSEYQRTGNVGAVRLGATREEIRVLFGEPEKVGGVTRKHQKPRLWKYGPVEFHFGKDDRLFLVYLESGDLETRTILQETGPR